VPPGSVVVSSVRSWFACSRSGEAPWRMRNLALASLHLLLTGRYGSSRRAPGISFRRRVPDTLVVWMLAHRLCVGTAPHYSIRSLILCGTIRASGLGRERRGGRPRTFWVLSGVGGVSSLFDDLFTMAAGHSLDADRVTHASEIRTAPLCRLLLRYCCSNGHETTYSKVSSGE